MRTWLATFAVFLLSGFASISHAGVCDEQIDSALWERGVCAGKRCSLGVSEGKLVSRPAESTGFKLQVTNQGALSSVEIPSSVYGLDLIQQRVTSVQLKSEDGGSTVTMFTLDSKSQAKRRVEYNLKSDGKECSVDQIAESDAGSDISSVQYDKEFCDGAADAFKGLDNAAAKVCQDGVGRLQKLYETRSTALKDQKKQFAADGSLGRADSARNWAAGKIASSNKGLFERAMEQRDGCARPLIKLDISKLLKDIKPLSSGESFRELNFERLFKDNRAYDKRALGSESKRKGVER